MPTCLKLILISITTLWATVLITTTTQAQSELTATVQVNPLTLNLQTESTVYLYRIQLTKIILTNQGSQPIENISGQIHASSGINTLASKFTLRRLKAGDTHTFYRLILPRKTGSYILQAQASYHANDLTITSEDTALITVLPRPRFPFFNQ